MSLQLGIPLFILSALLQATVLPFWRVFGGQPDLIVLLVLAWASLDPGQEGMVWAFVGGLFLDLLSGAPIGISSLILVPVAYLIGVTEAQVYRSNVLLTLVMMTGGALAYHVGYMILLRFLTDYPAAWSEAFRYVTLPSVVFDAILALPVVYLIRRWYDRLHPRRVAI